MPIDYFQLAADLARAQGSQGVGLRLPSASVDPSAGTGEIPALRIRAELHALLEDTHELEQVIAEMEAES